VVIWLLSLAHAQQFHAIRVEDPVGGPFPCVTLETNHGVRYVTDAGGQVAVYEPGLMGLDVWFTPSGPGVVAPVDGFGIAGVQVELIEGGSTTVVLGRSGPSDVCTRGDLEERLLAHGVPTASEMHEVQIVDSATQSPVPAVRVRIAGQEHWTDNGGRVAWFDVDDMTSPRLVEIWSHGYVAPEPVELTLPPGDATVVSIDRTNLAERLVRLTGGGAWRDSVLLGYTAPLAEPVLDAQVLGQDTAHAVPWRGGLFWLWGDTMRPSYPLGNFHTTGALAALDATPEDGIDFDYFMSADGFVAPIAPQYEEGPVWLGGLVALSDEELWATELNVASDFTVLREGIVRWDDLLQRFVEVFAWSATDRARPSGPAIVATDVYGVDWVIYRGMQRVPADPIAMADPAAYESWTPLRPDGGSFEIDRAHDGVAEWEWRTDAPAPTLAMVDEGQLDADDSPWHHAVEPDTGETPTMHQGSIAWNEWRGRWIQVFTESFGATSLIGEIWYAESDTPVGPWTWTRKVITHDDYSFYNPYFHPWFAQSGGRRVLFEGTYTAWLGTDDKTPRHDYNQQLYALDLDREELALPVAFYDTYAGPAEARDWFVDSCQAFGAWDRPTSRGIAIRWSAPACAESRSLLPEGDGEVAFYALPAGTTGEGLTDLVEWSFLDGRQEWSIRDLREEGGIEGDAIATVWEPAWEPLVPLSEFVMPDRADAGPDQCGVVSPVSLDGTRSVLSSGIMSWSWSWDGGAASGPTPAVDLGAGLHVVTLTVSGPSGDAEDVVVVDVVEGTSPPPCEEPDPDAPGDPPADDDGSDCGCRTLPASANPFLSSAFLWLLRARRHGGRSVYRSVTNTVRPSSRSPCQTRSQTT